jgi:3-ketosteroid 9alpha-monooxygenase subunit B
LSVGRGYHRIPVTAVVEETAQARSFVLAVPPELAAEFAYRPGQFVTVRVNERVARCYSLSSSPHTDPALVFTVKRVPDGIGSNWLCDNVTAGSTVDILAPAGSFTRDRWDTDLVLLAGGSGITPVISIVKAALSTGDKHLFLLYANRDRGSVIFADELAGLQDAHPDRLTVRHWLDVDGGPPTVDDLRTVLTPYRRREVFVCGPEPFMVAAEKTLTELGVPDPSVHIERFRLAADGDGEGDRDGEEDGPDATAIVTIDGVTYRLPWPGGKRLLDVIIDAGLNPPFSCTQGMCGACACRKLSGEVHLVHNEVLEEEDFADGYILACQALPRSATVEVSYQ